MRTGATLGLGGPAQPKMEVSRPQDPLERQADKTADTVMRCAAPAGAAPANAAECIPCAQNPREIQRAAMTPEPPIQRQAAVPEPPIQRAAAVPEPPIQRATATLNPAIQRAAASGAPPPVSPKTAALIRSPGSGRPLPAEVRRRIEPGVGADLSGVRVHDGANAAGAAMSIQARAFTHGPNIFLGPRQSIHDVRLMAHESAHVVQQGAAVQRTANDQCIQRTADDQVQRAAVEDQAQRAPAEDQVQRACAPCDEGTVQRTAEPTVQRFAEQSNGSIDAAPASADQAPANPGRPLEPALHQDTEQGLGHGFSQVRVDHDAAAEQPAQDPLTVAPSSMTLMRTPEKSDSPYVPMTSFDPEKFDLEKFDPEKLQHPFRTGRAGFQSPKDADPLYFHVQDRARGQVVTDANILQWAVDNIWSDAGTGGRARTIMSLFQRTEGAALDALWRSLVNDRITMILGSHGFAGSDAARLHFAEHLGANSKHVIVRLYERLISLLDRKMRSAASSGLIPDGADLVTDPDTITEIERVTDPDASSEIKEKSREEALILGYGLGSKPWGIKADEVWVGKRVRLIRGDYLYFEVIGYEGIYFSVSGFDLRKQSAHVGQVGTGVIEGTKGLVVAGSFIKGLLTSAASPAILLLDTAAKLIDMQTMFIESIGEATGWYKISHTCLSSTCQQYKGCLERKSADTCKADLLAQSVKDATMVIPLVEQARECLHGDAEACGGLAPVFLPHVPKVVEGVKTVREKFRRPTARSSKPTTPVAEQPVPPRPRTHEELPARGEPGLPAREVPGLNLFAQKYKIELKQLKQEVNALFKDASDPNKVHRPAKDIYDAEMTTYENGQHHTYDRERRGTKRWCRSSEDPKCGVPVIRGHDQKVDATLRAKEGKAVRESAKKIEQAREELTQATTGQSSTRAAEVREAIADAKKAVKFGKKPGQVSAEVLQHKDASIVRGEMGLSGKEHQSMHVGPSSFLKSLDDYVRNDATTMLGETAKHFSFDKVWKDWAKDKRRLGEKEVSVQELHTIMSEAIYKSPLTDGQKSALSTLLNQELFQKHGLDASGSLPLPYRTTKPLPAGKERTALKAKVAAEARAKQAAAREARIKSDQQKASARAKAIAHFEKTIEQLRKSNDPKVRARLKLYLLEVEKLKSGKKK